MLAVRRCTVGRKISPGERRGPWTSIVVEVKKNIRAICGLEWTDLEPERMTHEEKDKDAQFPAGKCGMERPLDEIASLESRPPAAWRMGTVST